MSEQDAQLSLLVRQIAELAQSVQGVHTSVGEMKGDLTALKTDFKRMQDDIEGQIKSVKRSVDAFEAMPQPYGRPKTFHSATEVHSVSNPVRVKLGYQG